MTATGRLPSDSTGNKRPIAVIKCPQTQGKVSFYVSRRGRGLNIISSTSQPRFGAKRKKGIVSILMLSSVDCY